MKTLFLPLAIVLFTTASIPVVVEVDWVTDYEAAFVKAKKEGKMVLINFTGSDWCGWCKRLDREVFTQQAFKDYAAHNLVLLKLDYPKRTPQPNELKVQNQKLARDFSVRGFPTILLLKSNQEVVLRTGYQQGGPDNYVAHLKQAAR